MSFLGLFWKKKKPKLPLSSYPWPPPRPSSKEVSAARELLKQIEFWEMKGESDIVAGLWRMLEAKADYVAEKFEKVANEKVLVGESVKVEASDSNTSDMKRANTCNVLW